MKKRLFLFGILFISLWLTTCWSQALASANSSNITLHFDKFYIGDTILFQFFPSVVESNSNEIINSFMPKEEYTTIIDTSGIVRLRIDGISGFGYFSISKDYAQARITYRYNQLVNLFLIRAGDMIDISIHSKEKYPSEIKDRADLIKRVYDITASGKGHELFDWQQWYHSVTKGVIKFRKDNTNDLPAVPYFGKDGSYNEDNSFYRDFLLMLSELDKYKARIGAEAYQICKADVVGDYLRKIIFRGSSDSGFLKTRASSCYTNLIKKLELELPGFARDFSKTYAEGIYTVENSLSGFNIDFYSNLRNRYSGRLREKLLAEFIIRMNGRVQNPDSVLKDALTVILNPDYRVKINQATRIFRGAKAYNFTLSDRSGRLVSLADFRGRVVFIDFYFKGCSGCANFYERNLKPIEGLYKGRKDIIFLSVSVDPKEEIWLKAIASGIYSSADGDNVLNLYTQNMASAHPLLRYYNIKAYPEYMLIDKYGKIVEFDGELGKSKESDINLIESALKL